MPLYEIHKHELAAYGERQRRGELLIHGMAVTPTGYRLHLTMTPRVADAVKSTRFAPTTPLPRPDPKPPLPEPTPPNPSHSELQAGETHNLGTGQQPHSEETCPPKITGDRQMADEPHALISPRQEAERTDSAMTRKASDAVDSAVPMLECPVCTNKVPADGVCDICTRMYAISHKAAERRRAWHIFKKGQGPRPK